MRILVEPWSDSLVGLLAARSAQGFKVTASHYYVGLAILLVLVLIASVQAYRMWEEIHDVEEADSPAELLEAFEAAHASGELDDEEFARVRRRLSGPPAEPDRTPPPTDREFEQPDKT